MDDQAREAYAAAERKVHRGLCPICGESLRDKSYCPVHGFIKSGVGTLIEGKSFDSKMLELVVGCN